MSEWIVHRPTLRAGVRLFALFLVTTPPAPYLNVPYKKLFHRLPLDRQIPVLRRANRLLVLRGMIRRKLREEGLLPATGGQARAG